MKRVRLILMLLLLTQWAVAQCSICTKTAEQLGEEPAKSLNSGIVYLMIMPIAIMGFIGYRWWKKEKEVMADEDTKFFNRGS
ncbi:MAG: hypothetical protein ACK4HE_09435 [Chitinophagaceae bacterium]